ncbi:MAG TPA: ATP-binding cassette domain-containing protein [Solirubrobacterales bacterium]|nr:ATP-binding cassette domain-containing protein [Solirubrobacterales bacterium]
MPEIAETGAVERGIGRPALEIDSLTYRYAGAPEPVLRDVSLRVEAGEFIVLAGRSGTGKTSLLRAACGLIPHFHGGEIAGSAIVAGRDTRESGPGQLADVVGYVAQDPETQIVSTTVAAELDLPLRFRGDHPAERARAVEEVALALNIPHLLPRTVSTLSGGEMQRVALAVALVTRPPLVLLDEPTSQLDPVAGDELIWLLRRLNEEWGVAILLAEHRIERCLAAADRVVAMERGSIRFDGAPREFLRYATDRDPALATPAARMFACAGIEPLPVGVRDARSTLGSLGIQAGSGSRAAAGTPERSRRDAKAGALVSKGLWVELDPGEGPVDVLRGIDLEIEPGERVALMGRNGAGKSTFLKSAAGLIDPAKGRVNAPGGIALLTQNPSDYLVRERVGDELSGPLGDAALDAVGLQISPESDPRDISGGERQRLALAIALAGQMEGEALPALVALDEPTRGMDRGLKDGLTKLSLDLSERGAAVLISTHDVEFAATFADRVVLLGDGELIADADTDTVLSGGWYFATEIARVLDRPGLVRVEDGARWLDENLQSGSGA